MKEIKTIVSKSDDSLVKDTRENTVEENLLSPEEMQEVHYEQYIMQEENLHLTHQIKRAVGTIFVQLIAVVLVLLAIVFVARYSFNKQSEAIQEVEQLLKEKEITVVEVIKKEPIEENSIEELIEEPIEEIVPETESPEEVPAEEVPTTNTSVDTVVEHIPYGHNTKKTYTYYDCLSRNSPQWKIQEQATTDENGLRKVGDYYCCAVGTYYSNAVGDKFHIILNTGNEFDIIVCDVKSDRHTDKHHQYTVVSNCMLEFYVDYNLHDLARRMGDCSYIPGFEGSIISIEEVV